MTLLSKRHPLGCTQAGSNVSRGTTPAHVLLNFTSIANLICGYWPEDSEVPGI